MQISKALAYSICSAVNLKRRIKPASNWCTCRHFKMKILFVTSTEYNTMYSRMGSERQAFGQALSLSERGHDVKIINILKATINWEYGWDIINILNAGGPKMPFMLVIQMARKMGIPVAVTPVYWPTDEAQEETARVLGYGEAHAEAFRREHKEHFESIAPIVLAADWVLPNAESEMQEILKLISAKKSDITQEGSIGYTIIPNGIDLENEINVALDFDEDGLKFGEEIERLLFDKFVLCVGRVEPRKNQHHLIEGMNILWQDDEDLQLVLMGDRSKDYSLYLTRALKGKHVLFTPPGGPLAVLKMMRRAACHVLLGYVESPGLVSLEAAALNKPIVISDRGSVKDYFDNYPGVFYCNPNDPESIAVAIKGAMEMKEANDLGELVRDQYNYQIIGQKLEASYLSMLRDKRREND